MIRSVRPAGTGRGVGFGRGTAGGRGPVARTRPPARSAGLGCMARYAASIAAAGSRRQLRREVGLGRHVSCDARPHRSAVGGSPAADRTRPERHEALRTRRRRSADSCSAASVNVSTSATGFPLTDNVTTREPDRTGHVDDVVGTCHDVVVVARARARSRATSYDPCHRRTCGSSAR